MSGSGSELCDTVESARLAEGMRELRGRTGLSLAALAAKTPYSKSSWQRYLNGRKLPPKDAVVALCLLAGEPSGRLVALWELADAAWSGRGRSGTAQGLSGTAQGRLGVPAQDAGKETAAVKPDRPAWRLPRRLVPVAAGVCIGAAGVAAALAFWAGDGGDGRSPAPASAAVTGCQGQACDGKDPRSMYCGGEGQVASVLERTAAGGAHIEVRYGTACGAAWGRLHSGRIGDRIEVSVPGARPRSATVKDRFDAEGYLVTPMAVARGPKGISLCFYPAGGGAEECFTRT
ncbi:helix-turn-helix domain-containing protein [Streptomyces halobius]|uniref:XRE family transcriptional regulator n=1 Tax=Streptomyces halobius TaxID=2879846 RepID=A0ABY4M6V1_9ACTN|nr:XRE family transcriptional regulator [Streptomyces halobius]UQA93499.1 XRE family transcriptional regulator [Streptomyces halobius]